MQNQQQHINIDDNDYYHEEDHESEEDDDALSFSNLPLFDNGDHNNSLHDQTPKRVSSSSSQDHFEFFNTLSPQNSPKPQNVKADEYRKGGYLAMFKSASFRKSSNTCHGYDHHHQYYQFMKCDEKGRYVSKNRSSSARIDQQVNITALTSMSAKSRRRMFMFGPVKFKPEMELSAIKERQGKKRAMSTTTLSWATGGGDRAVSGGERAGKGGDSKWGLVRSLSRSNLRAVLARSFGCIPTAGVDRLITVAN